MVRKNLKKVKVKNSIKLRNLRAFTFFYKK